MILGPNVFTAVVLALAPLRGAPSLAAPPTNETPGPGPAALPAVSKDGATKSAWVEGTNNLAEGFVSPDLAASMLGEARRLQQLGSEDEKVISRREEEVLQLIADGASTPEVASKLFISQKTVKNHLASIYEKLDARDRTQAVLQAVRRGIVRLQ